MFEVNGVNGGSLRESIRRWLDEDVGTGDVTTMTTVPANHESDAVIHAKQPGVVAGLPVAKAVFAEVDPGLVFVPLVPEGGRIERGTVLATVTGNTRAILIAERLVLNLLQRLSGVATTTRAFVDAVEGLPVRISDTRKTTPGLRVLEKYAVRVGGGHSHRFGLYDAVLIKDNHIKAAGGVARAIGAAKAQLSHTMKIEVEVETLEQLDEALEAGADIFLLDNMPIDVMREAVRRIRSVLPHAVVEASGSVTLDNVREIAETGVDVISIGRITHSAPALDISLDLSGRKEAVK
ncbi:MAG: nicotinate-nucleotide diphosphorylase (carboxylating) [Candidatus Reconcilbacillus cellulovorans]|mgnify:CR=1 FL=1|uniref:Probable nicotinate-nucleotide pyrophosphorylase [carboxylating] n=1 Tax=Candidatus Reconcilbacillus cellulovorans TaxID=1906605 RepID=A0A2A6E2U1_9BACL|nr:MAG: nicotinate-nucleotide diphosphorylase (carboxylating) [Candidatus Reconcilbacillus cellulovorans]